MSITADFDRVIDRTGTASTKWDKYKGRDVLPLWVADMDFASPVEVLAALRERVDHGVFGYTHAPEELSEAVVRELAGQFGWNILPEWIVWLPGVVCALNVMCKAVGEERDEVITATPVYPPFFTSAMHAHRTLIRVPLISSSGRWTFDRDGFENAVTPKTKLFLLCNPHNPVGRVYDSEELAWVADFCCRHNVTLCSDEIHNGLVLDSSLSHVSIAATNRNIVDRTVTLMAPSKTFNLPGFGCSFAVIPNDDLRRNFVRCAKGIVPDVNVLGYVAALAAYTKGAAWKSGLLDYLRINRQAVYDAVSRMPGCSVSPVEATYLAWIDMRKTGIDDPVRFFEQAGVGLSEGADFGSPGFVRLNFGCPRSTLNKALSRMEKAVAAG